MGSIHKAERNQDLISALEHLENQNATKGSLELEMSKFLHCKARERGIPLHGTFELTPLCNLDCKMCYVHLTKNQLCNQSTSLLSGEQWIDIIDQAVENGMLTALLTGGEAMLHPDFDQIFLHLLSRGVQTAVNTNGLLLTEDRVAFFQKHRPKEIKLTLYGADEDTYEKVTGSRCFERIMNNIIHAKNAGLQMFISITPNKYLTVDECVQIVSLVKELDITFAINHSLSEPRQETGRSKDTHDFSLEQYIQLYKRLNEISGRVVNPIPECDLPQVGGSCSNAQRGFQCGGGRSSFGVVWKGFMQTCLSFEGAQFDLKRSSFADCWKQVNKTAKEYPLPMECIGCPYEYVCFKCAARHSEGAPPGHANPSVCIRTKRMAEEGLVTLL